MCVSPLYIQNKSQRAERQHYLHVPCGHCEACNKSRSDGMEYRAIKEYDWTIQSGGRVFFLTMTYDKEHLPRCKSFIATSRIGNKFIGKEQKAPGLSVKNIDDNVYQREFYGHNKRDIQLFHKKLRSRLKYYGFDCTLSYFVVTEYGHNHEYIDDKGHLRRGTLRPHYHGMYFLIPNTPTSKIPSQKEFYDLAFYSWGNCQYQAFKSPEVVNNICSTIGYIAKYICKDEPNKEFARRSRITFPGWKLVSEETENSVLQYYVQTDIPASGYTYQIYDSEKGWIDCEESQVSPFSLVSKDFGAKHLLHESIDKIIEYTQKYVSIPNRNGSTYSFPCPRYYKLKFLYNVQKKQQVFKEIIYDEVAVNNGEDIIEFPYLIEKTETSPISEYEVIYNNNIIKSTKELQQKILDYYQGLPESILNSQMLNFCKYGLEDYLLTRSSFVNIKTGECDDTFLSGFVLQNFFPDLFVTISRIRVESLLQNYQKSISKFRLSKLLIQKENARKRAAASSLRPQNPFTNPNQQFNYVQKTKNPKTSTT